MRSHRNRVVELGSSAFALLDLESRAIIENLRAAEPGGTLPPAHPGRAPGPPAPLSPDPSS